MWGGSEAGAVGLKRPDNTEAEQGIPAEKATFQRKRPGASSDDNRLAGIQDKAQGNQVLKDRRRKNEKKVMQNQ